MDMLPVDRDHAEHLMLGTDEITVLATGDQTGGPSWPSRSGCLPAGDRR